MTRIVIAGEPGALRDCLAANLARDRSIQSCQELSADGDLPMETFDAAVYLPERGGRDPDVDAAERFCARSTAAGIPRLVLISSAAINEPSYRQLGHVSEDQLRKSPRNAISRGWLRLENRVQEALADTATTLTVLRPAPVPVASGKDPFSRLLNRRFPCTLPGFDPSLQLLSPEDLAGATAHAAANDRSGTYNVSPAGVVPMRQAVRRAGGHRLPVPRWLRRLSRKLTRHADPDELEYLRYPWTVSSQKIRRELGFEPQHTSAQVAASLRRERTAAKLPEAPDPAEDFDDFGMDRNYIDRLGRTLFRFLHDVYWRIEWRGLEHMPVGKAVLAGVHRGHQPYDGVMALHLLARELGRYPRFLIHPSLTKFPFLAPYMVKCGGIQACQQNADWVLSRDQLLAIFPEGINGAFKPYRDAYKLGRFGRDEFVKIALRHRAPIVPFVTVGSAEIFPILARIRWRWWQRYSDWPCLPITPTMSLLPLPSKWHTRFLEPIHVADEHGPEAADDPAVVRQISQQVRARMEAAIADMLRRRKSIFHGSIFDDPARDASPVLDKAATRLKEQGA